MYVTSPTDKERLALAIKHVDVHTHMSRAAKMCRQRGQAGPALPGTNHMFSDLSCRIDNLQKSPKLLIPSLNISVRTYTSNVMVTVLLVSLSKPLF